MQINRSFIRRYKLCKYPEDTLNIEYKYEMLFEIYIYAYIKIHKMKNACYSQQGINVLVYKQISSMKNVNL